MTTELRDLADIDRRLDDALVQLREQQAMVALIDSEHDNKGVLLRLLSSVLEQFYSLQKYRRAVLKRDTLALNRHTGTEIAGRDGTHQGDPQ